LVREFCKAALVRAAFCSVGDELRNRRAKVFNMFVEDLVQKPRTIFVSDSPEDASTLCTAAGAGTFVVGLVAKILVRASLVCPGFN